ncbi:hypothetical protein VOLCADRAFT_106119 [Volvox carteri f. nagariensis]|uniref:RING-type domain-containing protein n=1 Tax=Volvox carteri f. nagariensis TaxID=3068 RepID=D8U576_VOLCA|nr:uncharacterized protein VOLCADRAFT_106119 [Volvox carteri f. nagariensis]EFJ45102.1 hypothetical protein VOLCADRAFT_106119 [Volvox carteri f. nagariensis]|eukprot:XP_002953778.1 hypothetical protein VOLCADRAFT_106119 [Volvox carteri f. nagariensis]
MEWADLGTNRPLSVPNKEPPLFTIVNVLVMKFRAVKVSRTVTIPYTHSKDGFRQYIFRQDRFHCILLTKYVKKMCRALSKATRHDYNETDARLYEAQLAACSNPSTTGFTGKAGLVESDREPCSDTVLKAICNLERATSLAAQLREYEVLTYCAIGLAELQISRRDLAAASATFDGCVTSCAAIADAPLRASLLQRVLPKSMEVCNMQGRTADSFTRLRLLNTVLSLDGRSVTEECPICGEAFTGSRACLAFGCGHSFHRDCCDGWLGRKMFTCGSFRAECPVCAQVDWSLKPTPAATRALEEYRQACGGTGSTSGSNGGCHGRGFIGDNGTAAGAGSTSSDRSGNSSSSTGSSGSSMMPDRYTLSAGSDVESESSSCSGSPDGSDWESEDEDEDCAESNMR